MTIETNTPWQEDFSYDFYRKLLKLCDEKFTIKRLCDREENSSEAQLFLRHDIDISIKAAIPIAKIEHDMGIKSTYMLIPTSKLYDITNTEEKNDIQTLLALGHEVSLHYDIETANINTNNLSEELIPSIENHCDQISASTNKPVLSISFHRPIKSFLNGPNKIAGRTNAYAKSLMGFYRSDSKGNWRSGNPINEIAQSKTNLAQLLTHPIWWNQEHQDAQESLENFFKKQVTNKNVEYKDAFDKKLTETTPGIKRRGAK